MFCLLQDSQQETSFQTYSINIDSFIVSKENLTVKMDKPSNKDRFGWMTFDKDKHIPYLIRNQDEKFFCRRIVDENLFKDLRKLLPHKIRSRVKVRHFLLKTYLRLLIV
jgi:hypothetical protein